MKYARLLLILSLLVTLAFTALCFRAVTSVSDVYIEYSIFEDTDIASAEELINSYKGKNILFISTDELASKLKENTKLKVAAVEKRFPNSLYVKLIAREERYAIKVDGGYYILDDEFSIVDYRTSYANSTDGLNNVLLDLNGIVSAGSLTVGETLPLDGKLFSAVRDSLSVVDSPRDYVAEVKLEEKEKGENYYLYLTTLEGVKLELRKVTENAAEKSMAGFNLYLTLADADKLGAKIAVYALQSGEIRAVFTTN